MYVKAVEENGENVLKLVHQIDAIKKEDRFVFKPDESAACLHGFLETIDGKRLIVKDYPKEK